MKSTLKKSISERIAFLEKHKDSFIIDADTHLTNMVNLPIEIGKLVKNSPDYYHGRPIGHNELLCEMIQAGIDMCLIWQNPAATLYTSDKKKNFEILLKANKYIFESASVCPDRFIPAGWTDPGSLEISDALRLVDICITEFGFPIVKMNPAQNKYPIDSEKVRIVQDKIVELGAIPAFHYGSDTEFTPPSGLASIASRYPEYPILAVHMGGGGAGYNEAEINYLESRKLGLKMANIKFVLSARRDTHCESDLISYQFAGEPFSKNLMCASDAPYGKQSWNFGGYRLMFETLKDGKRHPDPRLKENPDLFNDDSIINYLGRNIADLTISAYNSLLEKT
jgi:predicted TIM-barrel fold metal-dependent hydrolase